MYFMKRLNNCSSYYYMKFICFLFFFIDNVFRVVCREISGFWVGMVGCDLFLGEKKFSCCIKSM